MRMMLARRRLAEAGSVALAVLLMSGAVAVATDPTPTPATADRSVADGGTHCVECYLFWDPTADARAVLGVPVAADTPAWMDLAVSTADGGSLRLADHAGRPMLIEVMATWCAVCEEQQDAIEAARPDLPPDVLIVSLDVDPAGDLGALTEYARGHGYDWIFAVAGRELTRELVLTFGDQAANPAASPVIVVGRDGRAKLGPLGHKDPAAIEDLLADA